MEIMEHLYYTKEHEWVDFQDEGLVTVGITDYAQNSLGDITFIELPEAGSDVEQFEQLASVESVKAASDIYAPVSGQIVEVNTDLDQNPELINKSCYELGWIAKIRPASLDEKSKLMESEEYTTYVEGLE